MCLTGLVRANIGVQKRNRQREAKDAPKDKAEAVGGLLWLGKATILQVDTERDEFCTRYPVTVATMIIIPGVSPILMGSHDCCDRLLLCQILTEVCKNGSSALLCKKKGYKQKQKSIKYMEDVGMSLPKIVHRCKDGSVQARYVVQ